MHIVLNYIGPNDGEGIKIYQNSRNIAHVDIMGAIQLLLLVDGTIVVIMAMVQFKWMKSIISIGS